MVQLMNSCCFNLSLQTNAFIKTIMRKLKMFHFLFSVYGIFLSHCVGFKTISVIINQYNGWLERKNKAFNRDEKQKKKIDFQRDGKSCIISIHLQSTPKDVTLLAHTEQHPFNYKSLLAPYKIPMGFQLYNCSYLSLIHI